MKYKVKVGSLRFEQGIFSKGDIIDVTEERAVAFDKLDIEPLNQAAAPTEAPVTAETPKVEQTVPAPVVTEPAPPAKTTTQAATSWGSSKKTKPKTSAV